MLFTDTNFRTTNTIYCHKRTLIQAMKKLGYPVTCNTKIKNSDIFPSFFDVEIAVDVGSPYLIGFNRGKDKTFIMTADWKGIKRTAGLSRLSFNQLSDKAYNELMNNGFNKCAYFFEVLLVKTTSELLAKVYTRKKKKLYEKLESNYYQYPFLFHIKKKYLQLKKKLLNVKFISTLYRKAYLILYRRTTEWKKATNYYSFNLSYDTDDKPNNVFIPKTPVSKS